MAESKYFDLAQTIMIERYGLEESTYRPLSFSEGSNAVSIKMTDDFIPVSASFPIDFIEFERIRRMPPEELRATFVTLQPTWDKLPEAIRELFEDIVEDYEHGELPQLKHQTTLTVTEEDDTIQSEDAPTPNRKVVTKKPKVTVTTKGPVRKPKGK